MLTVTRSPLTSPALRTMASASSYIATPSSPLSHSSYPSLPHTRLPALTRTPREPHPSGLGNPVCGSYFNLVGASTSRCRFSVPCSPACGSPAPSPIPPTISSILLSHGISNNNAVKQLGLGRPSMNSSLSQTISDKSSTATAKSLDAVDEQARRKPTFKLALPCPTLSRDDSSESLSFADATYSFGTPGTPYELTWSDSFDSVMTLKPIRGRVPTPYPKMDDSEWIEDVEEAIAKM